MLNMLKMFLKKFTDTHDNIYWGIIMILAPKSAKCSAKRNSSCNEHTEPSDIDDIDLTPFKRGRARLQNVLAFCF